MDDADLVLDGIPVRTALGFYSEVRVVHVGEANDLFAEIEVEEPLVRVTVPVVVSVDLGQHVVENCGIGLDCHDARVEPDGEPSVVEIGVRAGGKDEGEIKEFVKVPLYEGIGVQIHDRLERGRFLIHGPNPKLCVRIQESPKDVFSTVRWGYVLHRHGFPPSRADATEGVARHLFWEVDHDFTC